MRYQVAVQPERLADMPVINCPADVQRLLQPEMSVLDTRSRSKIRLAV